MVSFLKKKLVLHNHHLPDEHMIYVMTLLYIKCDPVCQPIGPLIVS